MFNTIIIISLDLKLNVFVILQFDVSFRPEEVSSNLTSVVSNSAQPELKNLDCIKLLNWESVGLQLGIDDHVLQTIKCDYHRHDDRKREMFRAWLRTCTNPNYHELIKALEEVGEKRAVKQLVDKIQVKV